MEAPAWFVRALTRDSEGRLRIRWSEYRQEWQIEQKVGRGALPPIRIDPWRDDLIRARDGYAYVLSIRAGDRMPCPFCHRTLRVPTLRFGEVKCETCTEKRGRPICIRASYWPLGESLLEHLRKIDPYRDGHRRLLADVDKANAAAKAASDKDFSANGRDLLMDHIREIGEMPMVGYTTPHTFGG